MTECEGPDAIGANFRDEYRRLIRLAGVSGRYAHGKVLCACNSRRASLLVPSICVAEVFKWVLREQGEEDALNALSIMKQGIIVNLDASRAMSAAKIGHDLKLPMADSIVLATARMAQATLWTQDAHFADLPDVRFVRKKK